MFYNNSSITLATPIETVERAIIQALLLGQCNEITIETYEDYETDGAIHTLAVSGLFEFFL